MVGLVVQVGVNKMDRDTLILAAAAVIASLSLANTGLLQVFQSDSDVVTDAREAAGVHLAVDNFLYVTQVFC